MAGSFASKIPVLKSKNSKAPGAAAGGEAPSSPLSFSPNTMTLPLRPSPSSPTTPGFKKVSTLPPSVLGNRIPFGSGEQSASSSSLSFASSAVTLPSQFTSPSSSFAPGSKKVSTLPPSVPGSRIALGPRGKITPSSPLSISSTIMDKPRRSASSSGDLDLQKLLPRSVLGDRIPFAAKVELLLQKSQMESLKRKRNSLDDLAAELSSRGRQETMKKRKTDNHANIRAGMGKWTNASGEDSEDLAKLLDPEKPLGRMMEECFAKHDERMRKRAHKPGMFDMIAPPTFDPTEDGKIINKNVDRVIKSDATNMSEHEIEVWNFCAKKISTAVEKEKRLRSMRGRPRAFGHHSGDTSNKFTVWKD